VEGGDGEGSGCGGRVRVKGRTADVLAVFECCGAVGFDGDGFGCFDLRPDFTGVVAFEACFFAGGEVKIGDLLIGFRFDSKALSYFAANAKAAWVGGSNFEGDLDGSVLLNGCIFSPVEVIVPVARHVESSFSFGTGEGD